MTQDRKIYQTIYTDESDEKPKQIEWTIEELRDRVINSESINSYYLKDKATHWKELFEDKLPSQQDLDGEKWRVVLSDEPSVTGVRASNKGRIKINEKIVETYHEERIQGDLSPVLLEDKKTRNKVGRLVPDGLNVCVYNLVAAAWLKGYIYGTTKGHIHHITNDGYDNRPENLILVSDDEHSQIHYGKKDDNYKPGKYDKHAK